MQTSLYQVMQELAHHRVRSFDLCRCGVLGRRGDPCRQAGSRRCAWLRLTLRWRQTLRARPDAPGGPCLCWPFSSWPGCAMTPRWAAIHDTLNLPGQSGTPKGRHLAGGPPGNWPGHAMAASQFMCLEFEVGHRRAGLPVLAAQQQLWPSVHVQAHDFLLAAQVLAAVADFSVRMWDAWTGKLVASLQGHRKAVHILEVSRPTDAVMSQHQAAMQAGLVARWSVSQTDWPQSLCAWGEQASSPASSPQVHGR